MDEQFDQFIQQLRSVTLTKQEKANARTALLSRIRETADGAIPSPWMWMVRARYLQVALLSFVIVFTYGGSLSYAAQTALPGETLYSFKTFVNEPLTRIFTVHSPAAYASFETELLNVRLTEAETLDKEQKLNPSLQEEVRLAVSEQSAKAETAVRLANPAAAETPAVLRSAAPKLKNAAPALEATSSTTTDPNPSASTMMMMATTPPEAAGTEATATPDTDQSEASSSENGDHKMRMQVDSKFSTAPSTSDHDQIESKLRGVFEAHKHILQKLNLPAIDSDAAQARP
jgi:hypothetical protein